MTKPFIPDDRLESLDFTLEPTDLVLRRVISETPDTAHHLYDGRGLFIGVPGPANLVKHMELYLAAAGAPLSVDRLENLIDTLRKYVDMLEQCIEPIAPASTEVH